MKQLLISFVPFHEGSFAYLFIWTSFQVVFLTFSHDDEKKETVINLSFIKINFTGKVV